MADKQTNRESFCGFYSPIMVLAAEEKGGQLLLDFFYHYFFLNVVLFRNLKLVSFSSILNFHRLETIDSSQVETFSAPTPDLLNIFQTYACCINKRRTSTLLQTSVLGPHV